MVSGLAHTAETAWRAVALHFAHCHKCAAAGGEAAVDRTAYCSIGQRLAEQWDQAERAATLAAFSETQTTGQAVELVRPVTPRKENPCPTK